MAQQPNVLSDLTGHGNLDPAASNSGIVGFPNWKVNGNSTDYAWFRNRHCKALFWFYYISHRQNHNPLFETQRTRHGPPRIEFNNIDRVLQWWWRNLEPSQRQVYADCKAAFRELDPFIVQQHHGRDFWHLLNTLPGASAIDIPLEWPIPAPERGFLDPVPIGPYPPNCFVLHDPPRILPAVGGPMIQDPPPQTIYDLQAQYQPNYVDDGLPVPTAMVNDPRLPRFHTLMTVDLRSMKHRWSRDPAYEQLDYENRLQRTQQVIMLHPMEREDFPLAMRGPMKTWTFIKHLGSGGFGCCVLWGDIPSLRMRQLVAVKDAYDLDWSKPYKWGERVPNEVKAMKLLQEAETEDDPRSNCNKTPFLLGYKLKYRALTRRLYMEFCELGSLNDLLGFLGCDQDRRDPRPEDVPLQQYLREVMARGRAPPHPRQRPDHLQNGIWNLGPRRVPYEFVWHVFQSLIEACVWFEYGTFSVNKRISKKCDWKSIIHGDIHVENILLREPNPNWFPVYPQIVVSDLGASYFTDDSDPLNPYLYRSESAGPSYWVPPELRQTPLGGDNELGKVSNKTNLYSVGNVMWSLICNSDEPPYSLCHPYEALHSRNDEPELRGYLFRQEGLESQYDGEPGASLLYDAVASCLNYYPRDRPGLIYLRDLIQNMIVTHNIERRLPRQDYPEGDVTFYRGRLYYRRGDNLQFRQGLNLPAGDNPEMPTLPDDEDSESEESDDNDGEEQSG